MLVLSRKKGESVVLPDQGIVVTVLETRGDRVRVGVTAPAQIPVFRGEVWERIRQGRSPAEGNGSPDAVDSAGACPGPPSQGGLGGGPDHGHGGPCPHKPG